jgi:hypothetical protein
MQQLLFAQHSGWHALPIGALATGQLFAGNRIALVKSAVSKNTVSISGLMAELLIAQAAPTI